MIRFEDASAFLAKAGWRETVVTPIPGDASFRRYARIASGERHAILMGAPPAYEDVVPFMAIDRLLRSRNFSAPEIFAADVAQGFLLLEDLGAESYNRAIGANPQREEALYQAAVDCLIALQAAPPPETYAAGFGARRHVIRAYDGEALMREAALYPEWYRKARNGDADAERASLERVLLPLLAQLDDRHEVLVLRDYHADNLMWLPDREGQRRVGLLDFQDALSGHPAYDLLSLLQDARRDVPPALETAMIDRFLAASGQAGRAFDPEAFHRDYAILGAQRAMKILGIFTRLHLRDGKPHYLTLLPRVLGLLTRNLGHGALSDLAAWLRRRAGNDLREGPV